MVERLHNPLEKFYEVEGTDIEAGLCPMTENASLSGKMILRYPKGFENARGALKGSDAVWRFDVISDRPSGVTSAKPGSLMLNIHRISGTTDDRGMNEPMEESYSVIIEHELRFSVLKQN